MGRVTSIHIAPCDNRPKGNAATIHPITVVTDPSDCIRDAGVDPACAQEDSKIGQRSTLRDGQNQKPKHTDARHANIEKTPLFFAVRIKSYNDSLKGLVEGGRLNTRMHANAYGGTDINWAVVGWE